jgi:predicted dehydrogenase
MKENEKLMTTISLSPPMRGAVLGYGFIASLGHLPAYRARRELRGDVDIVALADISPERRALAAAAMPGARIYESAQALIAAEAQNLDFVDIATPPVDHARLARLALDRGLHVLCEKPFTTDANEAAALLDRARAVRRVIFPCHNYKHAPVVKGIRAALAAGTIGEVHAITLNTFRATHARGIAEWKPDWRRDLEIAGGGIAMDHGSHTLYLAFEWMNGYPEAVSARTFNATPGRWSTEDTVSAVLRFPRAIATVLLTWTAGVRKVIYTLQGEHGAITVDDDTIQVATMTSAPGPDTRWTTEHSLIASHWMDASHVSWFDSMFDEFRGAVDRGDYVSRSALDAYWCVQAIAAIYASAREDGREIQLSRLALPLAS